MKGSIRSNKKKAGSAALNITSLMDVLTIILIFLLVNYSDLEDVQDIPEFVNMPTVMTNPDAKMDEDIKLNIAAGRISLLGREVNYRSFENEKERVVSQITNLLGDVQKERVAQGKTARLSIRADQNVPYEVIDELLVGAGAVGITQIDLLAMAKGE